MSSRPASGEPAGPLTSVMRHPVLVSVLLVLGLAAGIAVALVAPKAYTAETRVAVVPANTNAYTVAGYPVGARELAADYARWVQNRATEGSWAPPRASEVTSSPIPDSAVIRIEVAAKDPAAATAGADQVAKTLMDTVTEARAGHDPETAYKEFTSFAPKVAEARSAVQAAERAFGRASSEAARRAASDDLQKAQTELASIQLRQDAAGDLYRRLYVDIAGNSSLQVVSPAATQGNPQRTAMMRYGLMGLGAGGLLGMLTAVLLDRRRTSRPARAGREDTIGSA